MAHSIEISNFRCFKSASLEDCRRVNVIVGANGSGKTTLMEAIFLAMGYSPELALRVRGWRGLPATIDRGDIRIVMKAMWGDLFCDYDFRRRVQISLHGSREHTREVTISYNERNITMARSARSRDTGWQPVQFTWSGPNEKIIATSIPKIIDGKLQLDPAPVSLTEVIFFAANQTYAGTETAARFSELSKQSKEDEIVSYL